MLEQNKTLLAGRPLPPDLRMEGVVNGRTWQVGFIEGRIGQVFAK